MPALKQICDEIFRPAALSRSFQVVHGAPIVSCCTLIVYHNSNNKGAVKCCYYCACFINITGKSFSVIHSYLQCVKIHGGSKLSSLFFLCTCGFRMIRSSCDHSSLTLHTLLCLHCLSPSRTMYLPPGIWQQLSKVFNIQKFMG